MLDVFQLSEVRIVTITCTVRVSRGSGQVSGPFVQVLYKYFSGPLRFLMRMAFTDVPVTLSASLCSMVILTNHRSWNSPD